MREGFKVFCLRIAASTRGSLLQSLLEGHILNNVWDSFLHILEEILRFLLAKISGERALERKEYKTPKKGRRFIRIINDKILRASLNLMKQT